MPSTLKPPRKALLVHRQKPVDNRVDTSLKHASNPQASPRDTRFRHPVAEGGGKQHALLVGE